MKPKLSLAVYFSLLVCLLQLVGCTAAGGDTPVPAPLPTTVALTATPTHTASVTPSPVLPSTAPSLQPSSSPTPLSTGLTPTGTAAAGTGSLQRPTIVIPPTTTPQPGLPANCAGLPGPVYVNREDRFCFSFPETFKLMQNEKQNLLIVGPALDQNPGALRASLVVEVDAAPAGKSLSQVVDDFLTPFSGIKMPIARTKLSLGGEPAEMLEVVPGREGSRDLLALRGGKRIHLIFMPSVRDFPKARGDVEALFRSVTSTFTWLP